MSQNKYFRRHFEDKFQELQGQLLLAQAAVKSVSDKLAAKQAELTGLQAEKALLAEQLNHATALLKLSPEEFLKLQQDVKAAAELKDSVLGISTLMGRFGSFFHM